MRTFSRLLLLPAVAFGYTTAAVAAPPNGAPTGLEFSSPVTVDLQRGAGEPIIEIDKDGTVYTCGPTGFSQNQDYASASLDMGDQFNPIGQYPRGQFSAGGGGDCAFATSPVRNAQGQYSFAYTGLYGLVTFSTATSDDRGATMLVANSSPLPGVDRQWITFTDVDTVFHTYNRIGAQAGLNVQRSDNGGLTYDRETLVSPGSSGQGQIRAMPAALNPAENDLPVLYYPWSQNITLRLAVSLDEGATWNNCTIVDGITQGVGQGNTDNKFPIADHDEEGNIYFTYTEGNHWNTWATAVRNEELLNCLGGISGAATSQLKTTGLVQVNRDNVDSTAFPWLVADGKPGRVAVTFYGSTTDTAPDDTSQPHTWNVYVSQSLNMLDPDADFYQVKASSHPMHYDQICQNGLGCSTGGDRSLVDFFAIDYNPANGELLVTYNWAHKRPGDTLGSATATIVVRQVAGPSNGGGRVHVPERKALRQKTTDPSGDAYADFSNLFVTGARGSSPAMDVTSVEVLPPQRAESGDGFTVQMQLADLSDNALNRALFDLPAQSLLWIFYYVDGYRYHAASARWNPVAGFTFGHNGYEGSIQECGTPPLPVDPSEGTPEAAAGNINPDQCIYYRGTTPLAGRVDQDAGIIEIDVPLAMLTALKEVPGPQSYPVEVPAQAGDRIFSAAVYTQGNSTSPTQLIQSWLTPVDNTAAMDFLIPPQPVRLPPEEPAEDAEGGDEGDDGEKRGQLSAKPVPAGGGALPGWIVLIFGGAALRRYRRG